MATSPSAQCVILRRRISIYLKIIRAKFLGNLIRERAIGENSAPTGNRKTHLHVDQMHLRYVSGRFFVSGAHFNIAMLHFR